MPEVASMSTLTKNMVDDSQKDLHYSTGAGVVAGLFLLLLEALRKRSREGLLDPVEGYAARQPQSSDGEVSKATAKDTRTTTKERLGLASDTKEGRDFEGEDKEGLEVYLGVPADEYAAQQLQRSDGKELKSTTVDIGFTGVVDLWSFKRRRCKEYMNAFFGMFVTKEGLDMQGEDASMSTQYAVQQLEESQDS